MAAFKFRLQPLLDQRIEAAKQAEEAYAARQAALRAEQQRLEDLRQREQDLVAKRQHLRRNIMTPEPGASGLSSGGVQQRVEYVKALALDIDRARDEVFSQKLVVDEAEERVAEAKKHMLECQRQVEVLEKYRERLAERFRREQERKEELELDEIGNMLYMGKRRSS
jgi:flagellar export protein FliJ